LHETQLQLKIKTDIVTVLQNDVEQLHFIEDENTKLKSELVTKESDLKQWTIKVKSINNSATIMIPIYLLTINTSS